MDRTKLIFVDTETTGLDPDVHDIWELAWGLWNEEQGKWSVVSEKIPVDLSQADPHALRIGGFYERGGVNCNVPHYTHQEQDVLSVFVNDAYNKHIVGAVPSFDEERLRKLVRKNGHAPTWHYHLIDIEPMAIGYLYGLGMERPSLPWNSNDLSRMIGVNPDDYDRHTAAGDVHWAIAMFEAIEKTVKL